MFHKVSKVRALDEALGAQVVERRDPNKFHVKIGNFSQSNRLVTSILLELRASTNFSDSLLELFQPATLPCSTALIVFF